MNAHRATFFGAAGNPLVADVVGTGAPVLLLHGGGQTRHAWDETAARLAALGFTAVALDQRGHGESAWSAEGAYAFPDFAADTAAVARTLADRHGIAPIVVGASLGGIAAMLAEGDAPGLFRAIVLVDVTPAMDPEGVARVQGFMRAHVTEGFADVTEAAAAIAAYLPHRPRPARLDGLAKNLRRHADGRLRWHWDPRFLDGPRPVDTDGHAVEARLHRAAAGFRMPVLLIRGARSELVSLAHARAFLALVPHAAFADVSEAGHMVAGDRNDAFADALIGFLCGLPPA